MTHFNFLILYILEYVEQHVPSLLYRLNMVSAWKTKDMVLFTCHCHCYLFDISSSTVWCVALFWKLTHNSGGFDIVDFCAYSCSRLTRHVPKPYGFLRMQSMSGFVFIPHW